MPAVLCALLCVLSMSKSLFFRLNQKSKIILAHKLIILLVDVNTFICGVSYEYVAILDGQTLPG